MTRRILFITHYYPPDEIGGTEVLTHSIARELVERGDVVRVLCATEWGQGDGYDFGSTAEQYEGVAVERIHFNWKNAPRVFRSLYNNLDVYARVTHVISEFRPDVVHVTSCYTLSGSVIAAAYDAGAPILLTATDFWFLCARNTLLEQGKGLCSGPESGWKCLRCHLADSKAYRWPSAILPEPMVQGLLTAISSTHLATNRAGLRGMAGDWDERRRFLASMLDRVDQIVTASTLVRDLLVQYGVAAERISLSPYGIDSSWAHDYTQKAHSPTLRIGFIGQMLPAKGVDLLLRAFNALDRDLPVQLILYGEPEKVPAYGAELARLAGDDPRIDFAGAFPISTMGQVLAGIDVLVVTSIWYDFPLVIPSALATATPVIATDLPGMNEMIRHEGNGLLFPLGDVEALTGLLRRLLEEPNLLERLRAGIEPVKGVAEMVDEYADRYDALSR
jgi:glycosyltransferase involved in cell wall biosynthesis